MEKVYEGKKGDTIRDIYRFSNTATYEFVNWYTIDNQYGITLIDAGFRDIGSSW